MIFTESYRPQPYRQSGISLDLLYTTSYTRSKQMIISRKHMKSVWLLIIVCCTSSVTQADSGWTDYAFITELSPNSQFRYIATIPVSSNPSGCRRDHAFYQDYLSSGSNQMYTTLLEALIHGLEVKLFVNGKCDLKGHSEISAVSIRKKPNR